MGTQSLDNEFLKCWTPLSMVEKESIFRVARHYLDLKDETLPVSVEQYNLEIEEAMKQMDACEFYTHEQAVDMSKSWLNGK